MAGRMLLPNADHPITVDKAERRLTVRVGGHVIADTTSALTLRESTYPPVHYIPLAHADQTLLRGTDKLTYCPYKGDASYYSVVTPDGELADAVWTYHEPYDAVGEIAGHIAFYADKVEITES